LSLVRAPRDPLTKSRWRAALWRVHAGWLGLCAALAATVFATSGLKDLTGKPRPDLLDRCDPDLSAIAKYAVGGFDLSKATPLVTSGICTQTNKRFLDDGFASFPSGHSSFACAGLLYLSLWLCARLSVAIPWPKFDHPSVLRSRRPSAPPLWEVIVVLLPYSTALFVSATRYTDFHHAGFDIIAGIALGSLIGWGSFRLYHMPVRRSQQGMPTWDPRSYQHALIAEVQRDGSEPSSHNREGGTTFTLREMRLAEELAAQRGRSNASERPILDRSTSDMPILPHTASEHV
jgi:membrane-associated phospholipid phosphatase